MRLFALPFASALVIATATAASAATAIAPFSGVVVGTQHGTLLIAVANGSIHTYRGQDTIGARVSVKGGQLTNLGTAQRALVRGVLVSRRGSLSFLSAGGHMLVVHAVRGVASAADGVPAGQPLPGTVVQDTVTIGSGGQLDEQDEQQVGDATQTQVQGVVSAVAAGSVTLTVNGQSLTIPLPAGLMLPASIIGSQVTLNLSFGNGQANVEGDQGDQGDQGGDGSSATNSGQFGSQSSGKIGAQISGSAATGGLSLKGGLGDD
jgi:hypothetical protein